MSRRRRCHPDCAATLLLALAGCFAPTGSVGLTSSGSTDDTSSTDGDPLTVATTQTTAPEATSAVVSDPSTQTSDVTTTTSGLTDTTAPTSTGTGTDTDTGGAPAQCGDGVVQPGEGCDDGDANGDDRPCTAQCEPATCGDGLVCSACRPAEPCDDGNRVADDGCDPDCEPSSCGDGDLDGGEECDDGNHAPGDGCGPTCLHEHLFAFVTSKKVAGDFNGLAAADLLCNGLAAPEFNPKRKFVAWLSVGGQPASARIGTSPLPYVSPTLKPIAGDTANLLDGGLDGSIDEDESGMPHNGNDLCDGMGGVWTGTTANGDPAGEDCNGWTDPFAQGRVGDIDAVDGRWTDDCSMLCQLPMRIYCIEKAP